MTVRVGVEIHVEMRNFASREGRQMWYMVGLRGKVRTLLVYSNRICGEFDVKEEGRVGLWTGVVLCGTGRVGVLGSKYSMCDGAGQELPRGLSRLCWSGSLRECMCTEY